MRIKLLALLIMAGLQLGCKKDQPLSISYPADGPFGQNVLAEGRTTYPRELSFEANLGDDNTLRIRIVGETAYTRVDTFGYLSNGNPFFHLKPSVFGVGM